MGRSIHQVLRSWTRSFNRRRWIEEVVRGFSWMVGAAAVAGVVAVLGLRAWVVLPLLASWALIAVVTLGRALWRRTTPLALAYRVDADKGTSDLLATALAVERGRGSGAGPLREAVVAQAVAAAPSLAGERFGPVVWPVRALGVASLLALVSGPLTIAGLVFGINPIDAALAAVADATKKAPNPLDAETREKLAASAEELAKAEEGTPGLSREAKQAMRQAREKLESAAREGRDAEGTQEDLAQAEERLEELSRKSKEEGLLDPEALKQEDTATLSKALEKSAEKGDSRMAEQLGEELDRRREEGGRGAEGLDELAKKLGDKAERGTGSTGSERSLAELGRELAEKAEREAGEKGTAGERGEKGEAGEKGERGEAGERGEKGERGESGASATPGGEEPGAREAIESALREAREAGEMAERGEAGEKGGKGEKPGGEAGSPGEAGEKGDKGEAGGGMARGEGKSPSRELGKGKGPGGKERPGGEPGKAFSFGGSPGEGGVTAGPGTDDRSGKSKFNPWDGKPAAEWVQSRWGDSSELVVTTIEKSAHGERSTTEYAEVHRGYEAIAESAVQSEEIPLTRRDYIREYFEEIRPQ